MGNYTPFPCPPTLSSISFDLFSVHEKVLKMKELVRDTVFGHFLRLVTKGKVMTFEEERDSSLWKRYVDKEKSGRMAHHGHTGEEEKENEKETKDTDDSESPERGIWQKDEESENRAGQNQAVLSQNGGPRNSSETRLGSLDNGQQRNEISCVPVDPEKGRDVSVVTWYGENDPENPLNWSTPKKFFVTGMICLLTFSVYIGSAIYAKNFGMLLAFRFLTGFFGSPVLATGGASLGDMYRPAKRAYAIAVWGLAAICGPVLGPLIGGFAAQHKG